MARICFCWLVCFSLIKTPIVTRQGGLGNCCTKMALRIKHWILDDLKSLCLNWFFRRQGAAAARAGLSASEFEASMGLYMLGSE